jgi:hypothetical protein
MNLKRRKAMNANATAMAVEQAPTIEVSTKREGYTLGEIEELRQRFQTTGDVILPVLRTLGAEMFYHGIANKCIRSGLRRATGIGVQRDVAECLTKWGIDPANPLIPSDSQEADLTGDLEDIWRSALIDAFVEWSFDPENA